MGKVCLFACVVGVSYARCLNEEFSYGLMSGWLDIVSYAVVQIIYVCSLAAYVV